MSCIKSQRKNCEFLYQTGDQTVEIRLQNELEFLEYDKKTRINFILTNIQPKNFACAGMSMRLIEIKDSIMTYETNVPKKYFERDTLSLKVKFGSEPDQMHKFEIPIRNTDRQNR